MSVIAVLVGCSIAREARSADLPLDAPPRSVARPSPRPPVPYRSPYVEDLGPPASEHGYYGYYGFDIAGTPYDGLYSANVLCLRSLHTIYGYRTVDVCDPR